MSHTHTDCAPDCEFVHLHVHTEHSTLDGINRIESLPAKAKELGMKACAITDHGVVSGTYAFHKSCVANDIKPILGMEAYYAIDRTVKAPDENGERYYHLVLLAQNGQGVRNLFNISSDAFQNGVYYKPRTDASVLAQFSDGLLATSACLGSHTAQLIMRGEVAKAKAVLQSHAELFPDRFFVELQSHKGDQQAVNEVLLRLADELSLPVIYTADCHYTEPEDKELHEITLAMQTNKKLSDPKRFSFGDIDVHFCAPKTARQNCEEFKIPESALRNTAYIAESIQSQEYFTGYHNRYPIFKTDQKPWELLEQLSIAALDTKFPGRPKIYVERLQKELRVIKAMGFYDYFLVMSDFLDEARSRDILIGPGRGSVAGCLVAYLLGITQVDPIKYGLLFERFLTEGRGATPKIF